MTAGGDISFTISILSAGSDDVWGAPRPVEREGLRCHRATQQRSLSAPSPSPSAEPNGSAAWQLLLAPRRLAGLSGTLCKATTEATSPSALGAERTPPALTLSSTLNGLRSSPSPSYPPTNRVRECGSFCESRVNIIFY